MNNSKYSDNELHLMSYQELRRLSILLRLPANIKKKHMISMIQAHQKGDGCRKTAIANKIMEERKVKRLGSKGKQAKAFLLDSTGTTQQIPTDLSVSTKHEFETRYSYVAHYTSKEKIGSGISRIIKQEAEISRRNRSILQQPRKPTRKLSGVGRTEIMLPRNHSLTTPVRLMPQYERGFAPPQYEVNGNPENQFQDANACGYHFPAEYSNALLTSSSHELFRNEQYWHTREMYNNSFTPILSSLLTPNPVTINSSSYSTQSTLKGPSSFQQGVYEKYIKNGNLVEGQAFESCVTNSSTVIVNNHNLDGNNYYNVNQGGYVVAKTEVDFEINSALEEINCQQYGRRDDTVIRHANGSQNCLEDIYLSRKVDSLTSQHVINDKELPQCTGTCFRTVLKTIPQPQVLNCAYEASPTRKNMEVTEEEEEEVEECELEPPSTPLSECESRGGKCWKEDQNKTTKEGAEEFLSLQMTGPFAPVTSESSNRLSEEQREESTTKNERRNDFYNVPNFPRCQYILGHNQHPEMFDKPEVHAVALPSFAAAFCAKREYNKAYSICKNSFTGTTETHLNPIMTSAYASSYAPHPCGAQPTHLSNPVGGCQLPPRQWLYSYGESQGPFSMESAGYATWDEYSDDMENKILAQNNSHEVQVVKCRQHGCHYLYSISNSCD